MNDNRLLIHLPLEEVIKDGSTDKIIDVSGNGHNATCYGIPQVSYDTEMGSVLNFDGVDDYLSLPPIDFDFSKGYSMAVWLKIEGDPKKFPFLFSFNNGIVNTNIELLVNGGYPSLSYSINGKNVIVQTVNSGWYHFAMSSDPKGLTRFYINGVNCYSASSDQIDFPENGIKKYNYIGKREYNFDTINTGDKIHFFKGQMKHFRFYQEALSGDEIKRIMDGDKLGMTASHVELPLRFDLYTVIDDERFDNLFIEKKGGGESLMFNIINERGNTIQIDPLHVEPSNADYQFQLRFKKNILSEATLNSLQGTIDGWKCASGYDDIENENWVSFSTEKAFNIPGRVQKTISIPKVNAAKQSGARLTRAEVRFKNITYKGSSTPVEGFSMKQLEIQNHTGLKNSPFMAYIEGSNTLINNGVTKNNDLKLVIKNINEAKAVALVSESLDDENPTQFTIGFARLYKGIAPTLTHGDGVLGEGKIKGESAYVFKCSGAVNQKLEHDKPIELTITNWVTDHPAGVANIYIDYENIPGYWSGTLVVPVQFGPIVVRKIGEEELVGIGVIPDENAKEKFHVKGTTKLEGDVTITKDLTVDKNVAIGKAVNSKFQLDVEGITNLKELTVTSLATLKKATFTNDLVVGGMSFNGEPFAEKDPKDNIEISGGKGKFNVKARIFDLYSELLPCGSIIAYPYSDTLPSGWVVCDARQGELLCTDENKDLEKLLGSYERPDKTRHIIVPHIKGLEITNSDSIKKKYTIVYLMKL